MATRRFDTSDSTDQLHKLCNVHHTLGVTHYTTHPLSPLKGRSVTIKKMEGDVSRIEPMYVLIAVQRDGVISDVFAWHTRDPASRTRNIHVCPYIAIRWKRATLNILLYLWLLPISDL